MPNPYRWRWGYKPPVGSRLDRLHPLSPFVRAWWLFNEGAGGIGDISGNYPLAPLAGATLPSWGRSGDGETVLRGSASGYAATGFKEDLGSEWTVFCRFSFIAGSDFGAIFGTADGFDSRPALTLYANENASGNGDPGNFRIGGNLDNSGAFTNFALQAGAEIYGTGSAISAVLTSRSGAQKLYANGALLASDSALGNLSLSQETYPVTILATTNRFAAAAAQSSSNSSIGTLAFLNCSVSDAQAISLCEDPWQTLAPPPGLIFTSLPSGAVGLYVPYKYSQIINGSPFMGGN